MILKHAMFRHSIAWTVMRVNYRTSRARSTLSWTSQGSTRMVHSKDSWLKVLTSRVTRGTNWTCKVIANAISASSSSYLHK